MYREFWDQDGRACKIKMSKRFSRYGSNSFQVLIRFRPENTLDWLYHVPEHEFENTTEVLSFIISNLETTDMQFKVFPIAKTLEPNQD